MNTERAWYNENGDLFLKPGRVTGLVRERQMLYDEKAMMMWPHSGGGIVMNGKSNLAVDSAGIEVTTLQGDRTDMPSLWSDRVILLVFLRHFG